LKCIVTGLEEADTHHIYTRKAWPQYKDEPWNKMPLCHTLHMRWHERGGKYMSDVYPKIKAWLLNNGWEYDSFAGKWIHPKP
jgi:hypothetical protein